MRARIQIITAEQADKELADNCDQCTKRLSDSRRHRHIAKKGGVICRGCKIKGF